MALRPLQADRPLGQFDVKDSELTSYLGGEVVCFDKVVATSATDKAAADAFDGYVFASSVTQRAYVRKATTSTDRPLMLADDGIAGYGTLFGTVVGGTVGQISTGGTVLGPHTAAGSGKLTCWADRGLYAISLDAVDTTASTGLIPSNSNAVPGASLYFTSGGLVCLVANRASSAPVIGTFVEFATNGSLVTTPNQLVGTFNPPDGALTTTLRSPTFAILYFNPAA